MARKQVVRPVTVVTRSAEQRYDWATSVTIGSKGELRVYDGWRSRAFHPAGEWVSYTVMASSDGSSR